MQRPVRPGELPKTPLARLCLTIAQRPITSYIVGEAIRLSSCLLADPPGLPLDGDKQLGEVSASLTSDGRHRLHIQRECYRAYLDEEMSIQQSDARCTNQDPSECGHLENGAGFGARERICIDGPRPVDSSRKVLSWVQHVYFCKNESGRQTTSNTKLWCGSWMETSWYVVPQLIFARCLRQNKPCAR